MVCPVVAANGQASGMVSAVRHCTKERAIELFDYHTSTLYTVAFKAVCIAQIMPQARSLQEIIPLAREAYLGGYSGYGASSIAALIPAIGRRVLLQEKLPIPNVSPAIEFVPDFPKLGYLLEFELLM